MISKDLWLEILMVSCLGHHIEVWSGGHKKDVTKSNGRVRGQGMCGSGDVWDLYPTGCSGVLKEWILAHVHRYSRAEG